MKEEEVIKVNKILGKKHTLFFPSNQIIPLTLILLFSGIITRIFFLSSIGFFFPVAISLSLVWYLLAGDKPDNFLNKFRKPFGEEWVDDQLNYISPIPFLRDKITREQINDQTIKYRKKPIRKVNESGQNQTYMPFQNLQDLLAILNLKIEEQNIGAYFLKKGSKYQIVFGFKTSGIHNISPKSEIEAKSNKLKWGLKEILQDEKLTIHYGVNNSIEERIADLNEITNSCKEDAISILVKNEVVRTRELSSTGIRKKWEEVIFCTWTQSETNNKKNDFIGQLIQSITKQYQDFVSSIINDPKKLKKDFFVKLFLSSYKEGYSHWAILLKNKMGLKIEPMSDQEMWSWIYKEFNDSPPPAIPQVIQLKEEKGNKYLIKEIKNHQKNAFSVIMAGNSKNGGNSTPEHRGSKKSFFLPGKKKVCAVLTIENKPDGWLNAEERMKWLYHLLQKEECKDTKIIVEISPYPEMLAKQELENHAKDMNFRQKYAMEKGKNKNIEASVKEEETHEAQKMIYSGAKAYYVGILIIVRRDTVKELDWACKKIGSALNTVKIQREKNICWSLWLESLPTTLSNLLQSSSILDERRLCLEESATLGALPLVMTKKLDSTGVEFIDQSGSPLYVDLFTKQPERLLITGRSGSGKSVLAWRFIIESLARNIPVVGMDLSPGDGNTFADGVSLLGNQGAYYDITKNSSNFMEIPNIWNFPEEKRKQRLNQWKESVKFGLQEISCGKVENLELKQRINNIISKMLNCFLDNSEIIRRYKEAFHYGFHSPQWSKIPTIVDLIKFCSREQLGLFETTEITTRAINQIKYQINSLIESPLGKFLAQPSDFSPDPSIVFYGMSGLTDESEQTIMAINCQIACLRNALSFPKSLFVGDELSVLLKKNGFADIVGEYCAIGRKNGISMILLTQDLNSIYECSASAQILQNISYKITGGITQSAAKELKDKLNYPEKLIEENSTDEFFPQKSELRSRWLIEKNNTFWQTSYYPGEMILGSVVNNKEERNARKSIMSKFPSSLKGKILGLREFSKEYRQTINRGSSLTSIQ